MNQPTAKSPSVLPSDGLVPLEAILCTEELGRRPRRPPDYETESRALVALAQALADSPQSILQTMAEKMLEVFHCDSAGFSLLTKDEKSFFWPAIAGAWQPHLGGGTPRDFGPCGDVLDRNAPLLFKHWERRYPYLLVATPLAEEGLLVPFYVQGKAVGTIWAIAHDDRRKFDNEDLRQLESLGRFASAAYQAVGALDALRAADRAKDEFLAMLSHELRNPLGAIGSAVRVLGDAAKQDTTAARAHAVIHRQVTHLVRLVDDLLDVGRITAGKITLDRRPLDLAEIAAGVVSGWRTSGRLSDHRVTLHTAPVWVEADETRLEQVVTNLFGNALKFTPEDGSVTVRVSVEGREAVFEVEDSGIGMPPELIGQVFDLFVQGAQAPDRTQGGLGIGLTLVRHVVERHGGTVTARSAGPGRGSVFTVRLPGIEAPFRPVAPVPERHATATRRVLIIEDNDDAREMLRFALEREGHTVLTTGAGNEGIELAASAAPDIALIDIGLPGLDGYEVARRIRALVGRRLTLVALTGYGGLDNRGRAEQAGFDVHLVKPVDPTRLTEVIAATPPRPGDRALEGLPAAGDQRKPAEGEACPFCLQVVAAGVPVIFDHGAALHLECYIQAEGVATLVRNFLGTRPGEQFCYTCLGQHLTRERREIEKAASALRLARNIVVEPAICSKCTRPRITISVKQSAADSQKSGP